MCGCLIYRKSCKNCVRRLCVRRAIVVDHRGGWSEYRATRVTGTMREGCGLDGNGEWTQRTARSNRIYTTRTTIAICQLNTQLWISWKYPDFVTGPSTEAVHYYGLRRCVEKVLTIRVFSCIFRYIFRYFQVYLHLWSRIGYNNSVENCFKQFFYGSCCWNDYSIAFGY